MRVVAFPFNIVRTFVFLSIGEDQTLEEIISLGCVDGCSRLHETLPLFYT